MKKKIILSILVILFVAATSLGATMAWFTAEDSITDNVFTAGTLMIEADENEFWDTGSVENWNPGDCEDKDVTVEVTGSKTAYLRMKIVDGWYMKNESNEWVSWTPSIDPIEFKVNGVVVTFPSANWVKIGDWYYYINQSDVENKGRLMPGDIITVVSKVCLNGPLADNQFQGKQYRLAFEFEAIQTTNEAVNTVWGVFFNGTTWVAVP